MKRLKETTIFHQFIKTQEWNENIQHNIISFFVHRRNIRENKIGIGKG